MRLSSSKDKVGGCQIRQGILRTLTLWGLSRRVTRSNSFKRIMLAIVCRINTRSSGGSKAAAARRPLQLPSQEMLVA